MGTYQLIKIELISLENTVGLTGTMEFRSGLKYRIKILSSQRQGDHVRVFAKRIGWKILNIRAVLNLF